MTTETKKIDTVETVETVDAVIVDAKDTTMSDIIAVQDEKQQKELDKVKETRRNEQKNLDGYLESKSTDINTKVEKYKKLLKSSEWMSLAPSKSKHVLSVEEFETLLKKKAEKSYYNNKINAIMKNLTNGAMDFVEVSTLVEPLKNAMKEVQTEISNIGKNETAKQDKKASKHQKKKEVIKEATISIFSVLEDGSYCWSVRRDGAMVDILKSSGKVASTHNLNEIETRRLSTWFKECYKVGKFMKLSIKNDLLSVSFYDTNRMKLDDFEAIELR